MPGHERDGFPAQEDTVDALERDAPEDTPAFELDLDPEDQGSADAAAPHPD